MAKGICHANLMAVFEPRDPHKSQDAVASIWNSSPHVELNVETGNSAESSLASQPVVQSSKPCLKTM